MRYKNEPSRIRKVLVSTTAAIAAAGLFIVFYASSYFFLPPNVLDDNNNKGTTTAENSLNKSNPLMSHGHAELTILINGKPLDLSLPQYQNKSIAISLENNSGSILHIHDRDAWMGLFLESIGMSLDNNCLRLSNGTSYCSSLDSQIIFMVDGMVNGEFQHYTPKDGDKLLINYGRVEEISHH